MGNDEVSSKEAARLLGVNRSTIQRWWRLGVLTGRQGGGPGTDITIDVASVQSQLHRPPPPERVVSPAVVDEQVALRAELKRRREELRHRRADVARNRAAQAEARARIALTFAEHRGLVADLRRRRAAS